MSRRPGVSDRNPHSHSLLSTPSYPTSSRSISPSISDDPYNLSEYDRADSKKGLYGGTGMGASSYGAGTNGAAGGNAYGNGMGGNQFGNRTAQDLEEQNDLKLEGLSAKVRMLKDITTGIGSEVRDGTLELSTLSEAFSNTSAILGNTFSRMNVMARRQGGWFCNMMIFILFVIFIFIVLWMWRR